MSQKRAQKSEELVVIRMLRGVINSGRMSDADGIMLPSGRVIGVPDARSLVAEYDAWRSAQ